MTFLQISPLTLPMLVLFIKKTRYTVGYWTDGLYTFWAWKHRRPLLQDMLSRLDRRRSKLAHRPRRASEQPNLSFTPGASHSSTRTSRTTAPGRGRSLALEEWAPSWTAGTPWGSPGSAPKFIQMQADVHVKIQQKLTVLETFVFQRSSKTQLNNFF
jgi:hypothetical protein